MRLLFFGKLKEIAAGRAFGPPADVRTLGALKAWLMAADPALAAELGRAGVRVALNQVIVTDLSLEFIGEDEVAFMSPLSGG
jgi:molybdopterin converting factor small subunit